MLGWTKGLFESIFFSLVVGLGSDFVLHVGLAYVTSKVGGCKEERAKYAGGGGACAEKQLACPVRASAELMHGPYQELNVRLEPGHMQLLSESTL